MLAVFINCALIILGSVLGLLLRGKLPTRFMEVVMQAMGLVVLSIGIASAVGTENTLCVVVSLAIGTVIGEAIDIEKRLDTCGELLKKKLVKEDSGSTFTQGFVTASLLFCVGAMAIVGSIDAGIYGDYSVLVSKSVIDGVTAVSFAATLGIGVAISCLPVLIYQGCIVLLAGLLSGVLTDSMITEMSAAGGCLIIGLGINMLRLREKPVKVGNMLPAIFIPLAYLPLAQWLGGLFG